MKGGSSGGDSTYARASAYLKSVGFTNAAELARVLDVAMNPNSLYVSYNDAKRSKNANVRVRYVRGGARALGAVALRVLRRGGGLGGAAGSG